MAYGWDDLLFGEGFWLGLLLIEAILLILSTSVKYGGFFSAMFSVILFIVYYGEITSNTFEFYGVIFIGILTIFHLFIGTS